MGNYSLPASSQLISQNSSPVLMPKSQSELNIKKMYVKSVSVENNGKLDPERLENKKKRNQFLKLLTFKKKKSQQEKCEEYIQIYKSVGFVECQRSSRIKCSIVFCSSIPQLEDSEFDPGQHHPECLRKLHPGLLHFNLQFEKSECLSCFHMLVHTDSAIIDEILQRFVLVALICIFLYMSCMFSC